MKAKLIPKLYLEAGLLFRVDNHLVRLFSSEAFYY